MLAGEPAWFDSAAPLLEALLGPIALASPVYPFDVTSYYAPTMGTALCRKFLAFERLADPAALPDWKMAANAMEATLRAALHAAAAQAGRPMPQRPVNLDPGYLTGAKLVLASTKDFAHRLYLRDGIFAEITMSFRGDAWVCHQFTFPDFKSGVYDAFLTQARDRHLRAAKQRSSAAPRSGAHTRR